MPLQQCTSAFCCMQSLMKQALRVASPAVATSLRRVLHGLHQHKSVGATDAMLLRLYEPLLFRDLAAANPAVRRNALQLLVEAFPLTDLDGTREVGMFGDVSGVQRMGKGSSDKPGTHPDGEEVLQTG